MKQIMSCVNALKEEGVAVYMPSVYEGICTSPYCVVQFLGSYPISGAGIGWDVLRVHIYAPIGRHFLLQELKEKVENALAPLVEKGSLRPCEAVGACRVDDTYKAYACYLDYRIQYGSNR